jgi:DNA mismatch repair ATPase MutS
MGKGSLILEYIEMYKIYSKQYEQLVVVQQKGEFYEMYGIDYKNSNEPAIILDDIAKILDYRLTVVDSRCDRNLWGTVECPRMIGIPVVSAERKFSQLTSNNYVIVVATESVERKTDGTAVRKVTRIITPSTDTNSSDTIDLHTVAITVQSEGNRLVTIGICSIEMLTGKVSIYETYNSINDLSIAIDDVIKYLILTHHVSCMYIMTHIVNSILSYCYGLLSYQIIH